jgi:hypothetical protein
VSIHFCHCVSTLCVSHCAFIPILHAVRYPPLTFLSRKRPPHAGPFPSFSVIVRPRSARHFTLCVDCFLLTTASVGDSHNGIHSVRRLLLTQRAIRSPLIQRFTRIHRGSGFQAVTSPQRNDSTSHKPKDCLLSRAPYYSGKDRLFSHVSSAPYDRAVL